MSDTDTILNTLRLDSVFKFLGYVDNIKNIDKNKEFSPGDIIYSEADQGGYVYTDNNEFEPLFDDGSTSTDYTLKMKPHPTNCANCGAVLKDYKCEYCGTEYPRY